MTNSSSPAWSAPACADLLAPVADVRAEQRAQAVEVPVAVLVPEVAALTADDDRDLGVVRVGAHAAEVQPQVAPRGLLQAAGARRARLRRRHDLPFAQFGTSLVVVDNARRAAGRWSTAPLAERGLRGGGSGRRSAVGGADRGRGQRRGDDDHDEGDGLDGDADAPCWAAGRRRRGCRRRCREMFAAVPVMAMTDTASPSCSERAEA